MLFSICSFPKPCFLNRDASNRQKFQALEVFLDLMDLPKFRQEMVKWGSGGSVNRILWLYFLVGYLKYEVAG